MEIVHSTWEIILKQFFFKNFLLFCPYDVILIPKTALFCAFWAILADIRLFDHYNMKIIL